MHRFFLHNQTVSKDIIVISDKNQVHHIKDVLHLKAKESVIIFDEQGNEYVCMIEKLLPQSVLLEVKAKQKFISSQKAKITVACAIPKGQRIDSIIDGLTQLGVERIIPLLTERVIVKWDERQKLSHLKRWEKIALYAAQQSQRNTLPVIEPIETIKEVLTASKKYALKLIPTLAGKRKPLKDILIASHPNSILIFIGPEGDFTPEEICFAAQSGCILVSLGDLVLRVETAAAAIVSFIKLNEPNH